MSSSRPQFSWHDWNQWHLGVLPLLLLFAALVLYMIGAQRVANWSAKRTVSFLAGLILTFTATQSVIGYFDMEYFSDHMVQHLLLIMVAAPFFALSRPLDLAYEVGSRLLRSVLDGDVMKTVTQPLFAFVLYFVFIPLTHLTGLMNLMLEHEWFHHLEQVGFLVVGYLFFRAAFGLERGRTLHPGLRLVFVMAAVPVDTFTGLALNMTTHVPYPSYRTTSPMGSTTSS